MGANRVSLALVNQLGIQVEGKRQINAFGDSLETTGAVIDSIQLGDFTASNTITMPHADVTVIDGGPFAKGTPVGFLGWEFLANLVVEIDYEHGRLNFYDPATYSYAGSGVRLPVTLNDNFILIPANTYGRTASLPSTQETRTASWCFFRGSSNRSNALQALMP